jgi:ATP-dependent Clp protease ATP-binding subunit ClpC
MDHHWLAQACSVRPLLQAGGWVLLRSARRPTMFERFTDQARGVVVLAEEEAEMLDHNWIGTEHILLGLIREGDGVAATALESLGIRLVAVRALVEEIIGQGQQVPSEGIAFTPRATKVFELSLRESLQLGDHCVDTEHILLGLIREGDGVAAQVLVKLGAELNRVRQQVIQLISGQERQENRVAGYPALPVLADRYQQLADEVERLRALLRQHGIDPQDKPA